jgi:hypothetical protein
MSLIRRLFQRKSAPVIVPPIDAEALAKSLEQRADSVREQLIERGKYLSPADPLFKAQRVAVVNPHVPSDAELPKNVTRLKSGK